MVGRRIATLLAGVAAAAALAVAPAAASQAAVTPQTANVECTGVVILPAQDGSTVTLPAHNGSSDCFLVINDSGSGVSSLQAALNICNLHAGLTVDGLFGPKTEAAVVAFQEAHGLTPDGGYGNNTRNAMLWPNNDTLHCTRPSHF